MISVLLQFITSALVIVIAGSILSICADAISQHTRLGGVLVGSVLLAAATSLPELMVEISAARQGAANLAVGDLFGSSLFNLLILASLDLAHRSKARFFTHSLVAHALSGTMVIVLNAAAALSIVLSQRWPGVQIAGAAPLNWGILAMFLLGSRLVFYDQQVRFKELRPGAELHARAPRLKFRTSIIGFVMAAVAIMAAAPFVSASASQLANRTGLGQTFVGSTLVALTTSLPELVASLAALRIGAFDLAVGNTFGSNCFNLVLLVPLDMAFPGAILASVSPVHLITCLATILTTGTAILGQLYHVEKRVMFIEPDALLIMLLVLGSLLLIYRLGAGVP